MCSIGYMVGLRLVECIMQITAVQVAGYKYYWLGWWCCDRALIYWADAVTVYSCVRVREFLNFVSQLCSTARLSHSVSVYVHRFSRHTFKATNGAGHSWKRSKFVENLRGLLNCCA